MKRIGSFVIYENNGKKPSVIISKVPSELYSYKDGWYSYWTFFRTKNNWLGITK